MAEIESGILRLQQLNAERPEAFRSRASAGKLFREISEHSPIEEVEATYLDRVCQVLEHPAINILADRGEITFAMIKPNSYEGIGLDPEPGRPVPVRDDEAANVLREEILKEKGDGMGEILFEVSTALRPEHFDLLYHDLHGRIPDEAYDTYRKFMLSGPITIMLIRHLRRIAGKKEIQNDAVEFWRKRMGATKPENAEEGTIRKMYARNIDNNLVHGSDSPESVKKEIGGFAEIFRNYEAQLPQE